MLASTLDLSGKPDDGTYKPLGDEVGHLFFNRNRRFVRVGVLFSGKRGAAFDANGC